MSKRAGGVRTASTREALLERLTLLEAKLIALLERSTVSTFEDSPNSPIIFIGPKHYWGTPDDAQRALQMEIKPAYLDWWEQVSLLFKKAPKDLQDEIAKSHEHVTRWIEKESSWELSDDLDENKATLLGWLTTFRKAIGLLSAGAGRIIIVPDTVAFVRCPAPERYSGIAGSPRFDFLLLSTVLSELDDLVIKHRDEGFREKVKAAIKRYKGWRVQGPLLRGVMVHETITVRSVAQEPNFDATLQWLDRTIKDDRIIASVLEVQRAWPAAVVVLVTADVNLQNKADAASISWAEVPDVAGGGPNKAKVGAEVVDQRDGAPRRSPRR